MSPFLHSATEKNLNDSQPGNEPVLRGLSDCRRGRRTSEGSDARAGWQGWVRPPSPESSVCLGRSPLSCQDTLGAPKALAQLTPRRVLLASPQWFRRGTGSPLPCLTTHIRMTLNSAKMTDSESSITSYHKPVCSELKDEGASHPSLPPFHLPVCSYDLLST